MPINSRDGIRDWNYVGNERKASYTNLSPGRYTFRVKASNNDGVWNEQGPSIVITITPPFLGNLVVQDTCLYHACSPVVIDVLPV